MSAHAHDTTHKLRTVGIAQRQLAQSSGKGGLGLEFKTSGLDGKSADRDRPAAISQPILEMELRNEDGGGKFIMASSNERISRGSGEAPRSGAGTRTAAINHNTEAADSAQGFSIQGFVRTKQIMDYRVV